MGVEAASLQERLERWAQRLQNLTVSPLTRDYPDNQQQELPKRAIEAFESIKLPPGAQSGLKKLSGDASGFTVFLAAYVVLVARLTGDEDIAIGTSNGDDGRPFVLRVPIDASETFRQLYTKVQDVRVALNSSLPAIAPNSIQSRRSTRALLTSSLWVVCGLSSRKSPSQNAPRSFSASLPTMPPPFPRNTPPTPSRLQTWWSISLPQRVPRNRRSWELITTKGCFRVQGFPQF